MNRLIRRVLCALSGHPDSRLMPLFNQIPERRCVRCSARVGLFDTV